MSREVTRCSTLRPLAELIEAIDKDWPADTTEAAITKALAESKLLQVVGATIGRDLDQIESLNRKHITGALQEVSLELAVEDSLRVSPGKQVHVSDADIVRMLLQPVPPALILERLAQSLESELPDVVNKALIILRQAD